MIVRDAASCLLVSLLLVSCAPQASRPSPNPLEETPSIGEVLPTAENGLQVRQWQVADDPAVIAATLARHADEGVLDDRARQRLARNGLRFVRVPADDLELLRSELGGARFNVETWHGQVCDWRSIVDQPIEPTGRALAVDGRVRRFQGGRLRLMIRAWTIQMEDGPYVRLQLQGRHDRLLPVRLDRPAGRPGYEGRRLSSIAVDVLLEAGYAYVLTGELPSVEWEEANEAPAPPTAGEEAGAEADEEEVSQEPAQITEPEPIGPVVLAPLTIGELLFREDAMPPTRHLMVFVPRIPDRLFPPELRSATGGNGNGAGR